MNSNKLNDSEYTYDLCLGISIIVDKKLNKDAQKIFHKTVNTVNINELIICRNTNLNNVIIEYKNKQIFTTINNWVSVLIKNLQTFVKDKLDNCILLHGSCFSIADKVVFLIGPSRNGKSTALHNILINENAKYISDEIIAYDCSEEAVIPLSNCPIQLREDVVKCDRMVLFNDAWNMKKVSYYSPLRKEQNCVKLLNKQLVIFYLKFENCLLLVP